MADIGLHDQVVLVTRSQDHSSAVCRVTKLLVITAKTNVLDFIYLYDPLVGLENIEFFRQGAYRRRRGQTNIITFGPRNQVYGL